MRRPADPEGHERVHLSRAARVGLPFEATIDLPAGFEAGRVEGLAAHALSFDPSTGVVSGTPLQPGEFEILVHGSGAAASRRVVFTLPVTPDPATLWKNVPSDPHGEHARPDDYRVETTAKDGSRWTAASRRGRRHAHRGDYRDDAVRVAVDGAGGWHVAAVCDGAGSAALSRAGAAAAADAVVEGLAGRLERIGGAAPGALDEDRVLDAVTGTVGDAATRLEALAAREGQEIGAYATTLLVAAIRRATSGWQIVTFSIGDGVIAAWDGEAPELVPLSRGDAGEYAGETRFLGREILDDAEGSRRRLHVHETTSMTALVAMTDGVSDPTFASDDAARDVEAWKTFWSELGEPANARDDGQALLDALDFFVPGEHDDRTIAIFTPVGEDG